MQGLIIFVLVLLVFWVGSNANAYYRNMQFERIKAMTYQAALRIAETAIRSGHFDGRTQLVRDSHELRYLIQAIETICKHRSIHHRAKTGQVVTSYKGVTMTFNYYVVICEEVIILVNAARAR